MSVRYYTPFFRLHLVTVSEEIDFGSTGWTSGIYMFRLTAGDIFGYTSNIWERFSSNSPILFNKFHR
ncbi:MAG: hypothetical protein LC662_05220 [Rhodothermaceae bacterium]|nr:hypothetical protein [Rhodothermaceae bacterium]